MGSEASGSRHKMQRNARTDKTSATNLRAINPELMTEIGAIAECTHFIPWRIAIGGTHAQVPDHTLNSIAIGVYWMKG